MSPTPSAKPVRHILALSGGKVFSSLISCFLFRHQIGCHCAGLVMFHIALAGRILHKDTMLWV